MNTTTEEQMLQELMFNTAMEFNIDLNNLPKCNPEKLEESIAELELDPYYTLLLMKDW